MGNEAGRILGGVFWQGQVHQAGSQKGVAPARGAWRVQVPVLWLVARGSQHTEAQG